MHFIILKAFTVFDIPEPQASHQQNPVLVARDLYRISPPLPVASLKLVMPSDC